VIRIAICEDNKYEQEELCDKINSTGLFSSVTFDFFENGQQIVENYKNGKAYDFVFLDVDMPILNGVEAGKKINAIDQRTIIIFNTSYPQYAIDAFDCNAFNYLLKDSDYKKFYTVLEKALYKYRSLHQTYTIVTKNGRETMKISDIYFVECYRKHLYIHTDNDIHITKLTLSEIYAYLSSFGFYQIHQGYIVNFNKVISINGCDIMLDNGQKIMISVRKHTEVVKAYSEFIERVM